MMLTTLKHAALMLLIMTILTGLLYPLSITALSQIVSPDQANGSLAVINGHIAGSWLIGQPFSLPQYFHGRPSAATIDKDMTISGASNLGPLNQDLIVQVHDRTVQIRQENNISDVSPIPSDLATASASGLDPHISPESASLQVARIAQARNMAPEQVQKLIEDCTEERTLGIWGRPRVNVLLLNIRLDSIQDSMNQRS